MQLYVFYDGTVPLFEGRVWVDRNLYFAVSGVLNALCQVLGNQTVYYTRCVAVIGQRHPFYFIVFQVMCGVACSCVYFIQPAVVLIGIAGVYLMNGAIYASGLQLIDSKIHHRYNLLAVSVWLVFADIGSLIAQNTFESLVQYVCDKDSTPSYYCDPS